MRIGGGHAPRVGLLTPALATDELEREQENARAALGWFLARGEVELGLGLLALLWAFWHGGGMTGEARAWANRFLGRPEAAEPALRKAVRWAAGMLAWTSGDARAAQVHFGDGLALARAGGDKLDIAHFLDDLAWVTREEGDDDAAEALLQECVTLARERGDAQAVCDHLVELGDSARLRGDDAAAHALYVESMPHVDARSWPLRNLAYLALHAGDLPSAERLILESLDLSREEGNTLGRTQCLVALAGVAAARGRPAQAARLLGAFEARINLIGPPPFRPERFERDRCVGEVRTRLGEQEFAAAWAEGQLLTLEQAVADALDEHVGREDRAG
jgi:hypothetical protein